MTLYEWTKPLHRHAHLPEAQAAPESAGNEMQDIIDTTLVRRLRRPKDMLMVKVSNLVKEEANLSKIFE